MVSKEAFNNALHIARVQVEQSGKPVRVFLRPSEGLVFLRGPSDGPVPRASLVACVTPCRDNGTITQWAGALHECVAA